ncbi:MAG: histidine phosphatase family protein [Anaerolineales bacterium]
MAQRILILVRHGQYDSEMHPADGLGGSLTALGKRQARLIARRLSALPIRVIHHSTLRRARETAEIISARFSDVPLRPSRLLCECTPCIPLGFTEHFSHLSPETIEQEGQQAQRAFEKYFRQARRGERHEVVVCHGNIIRYFVCRALQVPPEAWANTDIHHCGLSQVEIRPDGRVKLISHNDTGHLPESMRTYV